MRFSERLYSIPAGQQQQAASIWNRNGRTSVAATTAGVNIRNELEGRYIILTHAIGIAVPGAAQNIAQMQLELLGPDATTPSPPWLLAFDGVAKAANVSGVVTFSAEAIILPNWIVRATMAFNAGAAANSATIALYGYSIPYGSLQAF